MIDLALGRYLTTQGVLTLDESGTTGDTFLGSMPSLPDTAVMLKATGGVGLTDSASGYDEPTVQVRTRGAAHDRQGPFQRILAIYEALVGLRNVTFDPAGTQATYVVRVLAMQSYPADLGRDENERWEWSQNYALHVRNTTPHRN